MPDSMATGTGSLPQKETRRRLDFHDWEESGAAADYTTEMAKGGEPSTDFRSDELRPSVRLSCYSFLATDGDRKHVEPWPNDDSGRRNDGGRTDGREVSK